MRVMRGNISVSRMRQRARSGGVAGEQRAALKLVDMCCRDCMAAWRMLRGFDLDEEVVLCVSESEPAPSMLSENAENLSFVSAGANIERMSSTLVFLTCLDAGSNCCRGKGSDICLTG